MIPETNISTQDLNFNITMQHVNDLNNFQIHSASNPTDSFFEESNIIEDGLDPRYCSGMADLLTRPYDINKLRGYSPVISFGAAPGAFLAAVYAYDYLDRTTIRVSWANGLGISNNEANWLDGNRNGIPFITNTAGNNNTGIGYLKVWKSLGSPVMIYVQFLDDITLSSITYSAKGVSQTIQSPVNTIPYSDSTYLVWRIGILYPVSNYGIFYSALEVINDWVDYLPLAP